MRRRAFTLVELLVVISIIALLIAILLPSLKGAREQAKMTVCLSNVKNMAVAVFMYVDDNRNYFPLSRDHGGFQDGGWINELVPYAGDKLLYRCPSDRSTNWIDPAQPNAINPRENSYATNVFMTPEDNPDDPFGQESAVKLGYVRRSLCRFPLTTIYLAEYRDTHAGQAPSDHIHADRWVPDFTGQREDPKEEVAIGRHRKVFENYGYVDGHAQSMKFDHTFKFDKPKQEVELSQWDPNFPDELKNRNAIH